MSPQYQPRPVRPCSACSTQAMIGFSVCWQHATDEERAERGQAKVGGSKSLRLKQVRTNASERAKRLRVVDRLLDLAEALLEDAAAPRGPLSEDLPSPDPGTDLESIIEALHDEMGWDMTRARLAVRYAMDVEQ